MNIAICGTLICGFKTMYKQQKNSLRIITLVLTIFQYFVFDSPMARQLHSTLCLRANGGILFGFFLSIYTPLDVLAFRGLYIRSKQQQQRQQQPNDCAVAARC